MVADLTKYKARVLARQAQPLNQTKYKEAVVLWVAHFAYYFEPQITLVSGFYVYTHQTWKKIHH